MRDRRNTEAHKHTSPLPALRGWAPPPLPATRGGGGINGAHSASTIGSPSSPVPATGLAAVMRSASRRAARKWSSTTMPAARSTASANPPRRRKSSPRSRPPAARPSPTPPTSPIRHRSRRWSRSAVRALGPDRYPRQQRRHPARQKLRQALSSRGFPCRARGACPRRFPCGESGVGADARAGVRPHRLHRTSSSGLYGNFGQANYGTAKAALIGLMKVLDQEGRKNDIRVNILSPTRLACLHA